MLLRSIVLGAALAALISAPAAAAPTLNPLNRCYVVAREDQREPVGIEGHGFTALSVVDVFIDDIIQRSPQALYDGSVTGGSVLAPFVESGQRTFTVRLSEHDNLVNTVTAVSQVTQFSVEQVPKSAKTDERVNFRGRGFTGTGPIYAHYVYGGKAKRTVRLGMPTGDCGTFNVKRKQFSWVKRPARGTWTIQFDQVPYYNPLADRRVPMTIKVKRTTKVKQKSAQAR